MPSVPVTSVRVPCIDGLVMDTVTPGMTAPLASVILPLIAPVVVLTVWLNAAIDEPSVSRRTRTGTWQCSRLMRLLMTERTRDQKPGNLPPATGKCRNWTDTTPEYDPAQSVF